MKHGTVGNDCTGEEHSVLKTVSSDAHGVADVARLDHTRVVATVEAQKHCVVATVVFVEKNDKCVL